ncbi:hypothetical protein FACS1894198_4770 [Clostridia bacterium]|nr:hypothetical protein FACS1894198_4770 [Clostridia bacterium]
MTYSDNIRKYKQNELALSSPEEAYIKMFDFAVSNLKRAATSLEEKDDKGFCNSIGAAYKMWGILVDAFGAITNTDDKKIKEFEVIYASIERKIAQILKDKDYETLQIIIRTTESIEDMWLKLLENGGSFYGR